MSNEKKIVSRFSLFWLSLVFQFIPVLWLCRDFVLRGKLLMSPEILDMSLPWARYLDQVGWDFTQALWARQSFCGIPFLANPATRTFYPPDLVLRLLTPVSPEALFSWLILFHFWALGVGGAVWIGRMTGSLLAGTFSGWLLVMNGYVLSRTGLADPAFLFAVTWMPWILHAVRNLEGHIPSRPRRWTGKAGLVGCGVLEVLAGRPDLTFYFSNLLTGLLLWTWIPRFRNPLTRHRAIHTGRLLFLSLGMIVLLCAIQLLPTFELQRQSINRSGTANYEFATTDSLHPLLLLTSLIPTSLGDPIPTTSPLEGVSIRGNPGSFWAQGAGFHEIYCYLGQITLVMISIGVIGGRTRLTTFWAICLLLSIALAMGRYSPVYQVFFYGIPGWDRFRVPPRVLVCLLLSAAALAGMGIQCLVRNKGRGWRDIATLRGRIGIGLIMLGWVTILFFSFLPTNWIGKMIVVPLASATFFEGTPNPIALAYTMVQDFRSAVWIATGLTVIALVLVRQQLKGERVIPFLILGFLFVDLAWHHTGFIKSMSQNEVEQEFPDDPLLNKYKQDLHEGRLLVLGYTIGFNKRPLHPWYFPGRLFQYGIENVGGYGPFLLEDYVRTFQQIDPPQRTYNNGLLLNLFHLDKTNQALFDFFQISGVISTDLPIPGFQAIQMHDYTGKQGGSSRLFLNRNPRLIPRAFLYQASPQVLYPKPQSELGHADLEQIRSDQVRLKVEAVQACSLTLLETWYPGWNCTVNGSTVPIDPIAGTFRSIPIPPGKSEVIFSYTPLAWKVGCLMTLCGCLLFPFWCLTKPRYPR